MPLQVVFDLIDAQSDDLAPALRKLVVHLRDVAELRLAHRREVLRMGKEHRPSVADPLVETDLSMARVRLEVRSCIVDP